MAMTMIIQDNSNNAVLTTTSTRTQDPLFHSMYSPLLQSVGTSAELTKSSVSSNTTIISASDSNSDSNSSPFTIRSATLEDASAIAELGATTFSNTFGFSIPPVDLQAYLSEAYTVEAIEDDLCSPSTHIVVACDGSEVIGFAQLTEYTTEPCVAHIPSLVELQRLYVNSDFQGLGIGKALVLETERIARDKGYKNIWLGVWEGNFAAQRAYEKMGFARVGEHEFSMGKCVQIDWMMWKEI